MQGATQTYENTVFVQSDYNQHELQNILLIIKKYEFSQVSNRVY